jgi:hypothetical protein
MRDSNSCNQFLHGRAHHISNGYSRSKNNSNAKPKWSKIVQYNSIDTNIDKLISINREVHEFSITTSSQNSIELHDKLFNTKQNG